MYLYPRVRMNQILAKMDLSSKPRALNRAGQNRAWFETPPIITVPVINPAFS